MAFFTLVKNWFFEKLLIGVKICFLIFLYLKLKLYELTWAEILSIKKFKNFFELLYKSIAEVLFELIVFIQIGFIAIISPFTLSIIIIIEGLNSIEWGKPRFFFCYITNFFK